GRCRFLCSRSCRSGLSLCRGTAAALRDVGLERYALRFIGGLVSPPFFGTCLDRFLLSDRRKRHERCADNSGANDSDGTHPQLLWLKPLGVFLALIHEALLGGAGERLAIAAHGLPVASVVLALLEETGFRSARQRFAVFTHGLGLAGLCECGAGGKCSNQRCKKNALHHFPPMIR